MKFFQRMQSREDGGLERQVGSSAKRELSDRDAVRTVPETG